MTKPQFLYHGSCKGIENTLLPRPQRGNINGDFPEGQKNVVFATDDQNLAAVYTLKTPEMLQAGECDGKNFSIFRDYNTWAEKLKSSDCNVYALPSENFINNINKKDGKPTKEWQSDIEAKPVFSIHYTPEKVMETGAQLFFLNPEVNPDIWHYTKEYSSSESFLNRVTQKRNSGILPESFTVFNLARELIDAGLMAHLNAKTNIKPANLEKSPYAYLIKDDIDWLKQQTQQITKKSLIETFIDNIKDRFTWLKQHIFTNKSQENYENNAAKTTTYTPITNRINYIENDIQERTNGKTWVNSLGNRTGYQINL